MERNEVSRQPTCLHGVTPCAQARRPLRVITAIRLIIFLRQLKGHASRPARTTILSYVVDLFLQAAVRLNARSSLVSKRSRKLNP